jgi:uncharacterized protein YbaR (Trm112 family)
MTHDLMRIIVCPDSFKGSLSSVEAADAIARGIQIGGSVILNAVKDLSVMSRSFTAFRMTCHECGAV